MSPLKKNNILKTMQCDEQMLNALRTVIIRDFKDYADEMVLYAGANTEGHRIIIIEWASNPMDHPDIMHFSTLTISTYSIADLFTVPYWYDVIHEKTLDDYIKLIETYIADPDRANTTDAFLLAMCKMARNNHFRYASIISGLITVQALDNAFSKNLIRYAALKQTTCGSDEECEGCEQCSSSQGATTTVNKVTKKRSVKKNGKKKV